MCAAIKQINKILSVERSRHLQEMAETPAQSHLQHPVPRTDTRLAVTIEVDNLLDSIPGVRP